MRALHALMHTSTYKRTFKFLGNSYIRHAIDNYLDIVQFLQLSE